jgi:signal transduction histidine kinase/ligand-binding sensor domain-containing protein/DNA-binding NarL/FixJ family response regulator
MEISEELPSSRVDPSSGIAVNRYRFTDRTFSFYILLFILFIQSFSLRWRVLLLLLLSYPLLFSHSNLFAQTEQLIFEHYSTGDGVSGSIVNTIIQDKTGYLWFGTNNGLDRFDGIEFKSYKHIHGDTISISNGFVKCLLEDRNGNLWVGTTNGFDKFYYETESFTHYKIFSDRYNRNSNYITSIVEDRDGFLWLGTYDGLHRFDPSKETFTHFRRDSLDTATLVHDQVFAILIDSRDVLWIGTRGGLDKYDSETGSFIHYWQDPVYRAGHYKLGTENKYCVTSLYEDKTGVLWIGTNGGLLEYESRSEKFLLYESDPNNSTTLTFNHVTSIYEEDDISLWVGTHVGLNLLNKYTKNITRFYPNDKIPTSLSFGQISSILRERSGTLWVTTYGGGINKVNRTTYPFTQYNFHSWRETGRFSSASILYLANSHDGSLWIATPTDLLKFDPQSEQFRPYNLNKNIRTVAEDRDGSLWININISSGRGLLKMGENGQITNITDSSGNEVIWLINDFIVDGDSTMWACTADGEGLIKINTRSNTFSLMCEQLGNIQTIHKSKDGLIWLGSMENGLLCFDPVANIMVAHHLSDPNIPSSISGNTVLTIHEDEQGNLWLGTNMGLNKFDRIKQDFYSYTESDGLSHNWVNKILEDEHNNLWLTTLEGVSKFNPHTETFNNYDILHGLVAVERAGFGLRTDNGEIYLDSPGGLIRFHPDSIRNNTYIPPIVITSISVMGEDVPYQDQIYLTHSMNDLTFGFAALNYVRSEKNLYAYKLEGSDNAWSFAGTNRYASYNNLNPGEYTFRVRGSNNDGIWSEDGVAVNIIILSPWWKSMWAYMLYIVVLGSIVFTMWKAQLKKIRIQHQYEMGRFEARKIHESDEMKLRFFTNVSHELRTPLTLILGPVEDILKSTKEPKTEQIAGLIKRNTGRLLVLVNQLLDIAKFESGNMKLQAVPQNIIPLVKLLVLSFTAYAERKQIALAFNSTGNEIIVYLDRDKLEKMITNILSNAFRFTPVGGTIEINVKSNPSSDSLFDKQAKNEGFVEISVSDTGIGIPEEKLPKIFNRFYQVDGSHTRVQGGAGLGLSLTKELVELHKGEIEAESVEGKGTIFRIKLPLGKGHLKPEEIGRTEAEQSRAIDEDESRNIAEAYEDETYNTIEPKFDIEIFEKKCLPLLLLVEDNPDMRQYMKDILKIDHRILEAHDGEDGWNKSIEHIPDLIISDIMMPKMDGFALCEKLKTDEKTSHIPVILLTAKAAKEDKIEGYESGADEYILKPFEPDELRARIKNIIEQRKRIHEDFRKNGMPGLNLANITPVDKKFLQNAYDIITQHIADKSFGVEVFARELCVSKSVLHKKIVSLTGEPPVEFIRKVRLHRAVRLIEYNFGNLSEIALEVGFSNPAYFSECFKRQFGVSPSQYKRDGGCIKN